MIYIITYIFENRINCIKCQGKGNLIKQYCKLIQQNADVLVIKNMLGEEVYIELP